MKEEPKNGETIEAAAEEARLKAESDKQCKCDKVAGDNKFCKVHPSPQSNP